MDAEQGIVDEERLAAEKERAASMSQRTRPSAVTAKASLQPQRNPLASGSFHAQGPLTTDAVNQAKQAAAGKAHDHATRTFMVFMQPIISGKNNTLNTYLGPITTTQPEDITVSGEYCAYLQCMY